MPQPYAGNGSIPFVTLGAGFRMRIMGWSNTTPVVVQSVGSAFSSVNTGDTVEIEGTGGNIDGVWQVTRQDSSHLILNGSTATGGSATEGYVVDYQIQPALTIPSSGDLAQAGDVAIVGEASANSVPFLYRLTGTYRTHDIYFKKYNTIGVFNSLLNYNGDSTYHLITGCGNLFSFANPKPNVNPGDYLDVSWVGTFGVSSGTPGASTAFALGITTDGGVTYSLTTAAGGAVSILAQTSNVQYPINLSGVFQYIGANGSLFDFGLLTISSDGAADNNIVIYGPWGLTVKHYRHN